MDQRPIGVIDSGVGGMTVLKPLLRTLGSESVVYFGDSLRMPYGNREPEEIIRLADAMIAFLERMDVKIILVACNTISCFIGSLTSHVPLLSIVDGGVDEAVMTGEKVMGLIATAATVKCGLYEKLLSERGVRLVSSSSVSLPKIIDSQLEEAGLLHDSIKEIVDPILEAEPAVGSVILGCSHFPIIREEISQMYPGLNLIDPAEGQIRRLASRLGGSGSLSSGNAGIYLYTTAETYEYAAAIKRLKLEVESLVKVVLEI